MLFLSAVSLNVTLLWLVALQVIPPWLGAYLAYFINTVLVAIATQYLKAIWPGIRENFPWLIPVITPILGFALTFVSELLSGLLGYPVDLSPILGGITTGGLAVYLHQLGRQFNIPNVVPFAYRR